MVRERRRHPRSLGGGPVALTTRVTAQDLIARLQGCLGAQRVITEDSKRKLLSSDFYREGTTCVTAIRPADTESLAEAARVVTEAGYALIPRGGGMSYTGGYTPDIESAVIVDLGDMTGVVDFNPEDMTITVRAGTTWEEIYEALRPQGLRLPFFGTFSGRRATIGGGLSNGAVFFGTARYGSAADNTLGIEVVCADGRILHTGQAAFRNGKPFYRTNGPDLTGLFLHDCGALGIKTQATLKLIAAPTHYEHLSFAFADAPSAAAALSMVARSGTAEDAYVFDPETTAKNMASGNLADDVRRLGDIVTGQSGLMEGIKAGARVVAAGKGIVPENTYSVHLTCAGYSLADAHDDRDRARKIVEEAGGKEIPNSIPLAVRATPFDNLNGVLGAAGERWVALNAKVPHSDAAKIIERFDALIAPHKSKMEALGVTLSTLFIAMDTHAFSFEPVFHWPDRWLPMHREVPDPAYLKSLTVAPDNPQAAALVDQLRKESLALFSELGAASNQIGRTYPYRDNLDPPTRALLDALKAELDPDGLMNPGVLGYR
ncbi:MAG: FAD-binding oxidoreductase [Gammaproteobacteria bacterium]